MLLSRIMLSKTLAMAENRCGTCSGLISSANKTRQEMELCDNGDGGDHSDGNGMGMGMGMVSVEYT